MLGLGILAAVLALLSVVTRKNSRHPLLLVGLAAFGRTRPGGHRRPRVGRAGHVLQRRLVAGMKGTRRRPDRHESRDTAPAAPG